jgi:hypothetical protein
LRRPAAKTLELCRNFPNDCQEIFGAFPELLYGKVANAIAGDFHH